MAGLATSFYNIVGVFFCLFSPRLIHLLRSKKLAISTLLFTVGVGLFLLGVAGSIIWVALALSGVSYGFLPLLLVTLMDLPEVGQKRMGMVGVYSLPSGR